MYAVIIMLYIKEDRVPLDKEVNELRVAVASLNMAYLEAKKSNSEIAGKIWLIDCLRGLNDCIKNNHAKKKGFPITTIGLSVNDLLNGLKENNPHKVYASRDEIDEILGLLPEEAKSKSKIIIGS